MKRNVRFYFSFRSPYSWIATRMLAERSPATLQLLEYIPLWEPDAVSEQLLRDRGAESTLLYTTMSRAKHLYILQDIRRLTTKLGYEMAWPVDIDPWWERPHLAYLVARQCGKGPEFFKAVYRARWTQGADICTEQVIRELAIEAGVEPDPIANAPGDPEIRREGVDGLYRAYHDGVFGVPFFIHKFEKYWGVDRVDAFLAGLASVAAKEVVEHEVR